MIPSDLIKALNDGKRIAILTHTSPDGDAIGSSLALAHSLINLGKQVDLFCQDTLPDIYDYLNGIHLFKQKLMPQDWYDVSVALDCSDPERLGTLSGISKSAGKTLNIDHHITNTYFADINYVNINAAATSEIVYELTKTLGVTLDLPAAEALYTGILTDTGNFSYSNVTPTTHRIAAELIQYGVNTEKIAMLIYKNHSLNKVKLWGRAIDSMEIGFDGKFAMITITSDMFVNNGAKEFDVEGVINLALDIKGVELAVLLREIESGGVKISFRSKTVLDVSQLAAKFGGGGHRKAAGCLLKEDIEHSKEIIKATVSNIFTNAKD